jgi:hypothetical protein
MKHQMLWGRPTSSDWRCHCMLQARVTMRRLCVRLIEKTRQQMAALGLDAATDNANGKRPSSNLVTAVTNGMEAAVCTRCCSC